MQWEDFDRRRIPSTDYECPTCGRESSTIDIIGAEAYEKFSGPLYEEVHSLRARCRNGHEWMEVEEAVR